MGFSYRKSSGPLRFSVSKSGPRVSCGGCLLGVSAFLMGAFVALWYFLGM